MLNKVVSGIMLALLLTNMLFLAFRTQVVGSGLNTIIVPDNYPTIQEAINHADEGDTIFVRNGTYCEHVVVNKTVSLIGENRDTTIIDGNGTGDVVYVTAEHVNISGFTIRKGVRWGEIGIFLRGVEYCTIMDNNIVSNAIGVYVDEYFGHNNIIGNTIKSNLYRGIWLDRSDDNIIYHNNFINNTEQAYITDSFNNIWDDGYPSGGNYWSDYTGVDEYSGPYQNETGGDGLGDAPYIIDASNIDHYPLLHLWSSLPVHNVDTGLNYTAIQEAIDAPETLEGHTILVDAGIYVENIVVDKTINLFGFGSDVTIKSLEENHSIIEINADKVNVSGFCIRETQGWGVSGQPASGIYLRAGSRCSISNCTLKNNLDGIWICTSENVISNNVVHNITQIGISLSSVGASRNLILNNDITNSSMGISLSWHSYENTILGNNLSRNYRGLMLGGPGCHHNNISQNLILDSIYGGIDLQQENFNNAIYENKIFKNPHGILLYGTNTGNMIFGNDIIECNLDGIEAFGEGNRVYHNNFINNTHHAIAYALVSNEWDDGYPSGGNYWDDYTNVDEYSGPYQNETGSDGIWDHPYIMNNNNTDNYPLMERFVERDVGLKVDDWVRLDIDFFWNYSYPVPVVISKGIPNLNNTQWIKYIVESVYGLNVTYSRIQRFKNDTETCWKGWIDIETGQNLEIINETCVAISMPPWLISANLAEGDSVYAKIPVKLNKTVLLEYVSVFRWVNILNITIQGLPYEPYDVTFIIVWDRETGVLCECAEYWSLNGNIVGWASIRIDDTNLWGFVDDIPPTIKNVRHEPLYPTSADEIQFYADVTDNVAVAKVQLNYTEDGGKTWLLRDMLLLEGNTYLTSLGPYSQGQILGFYVIAYDTSGNMAIGSEIVPPLPEPPEAAPVVVSDETPNPLPDGKNVSYNVTDGGIDIYVNVTEIGIYVPDLWYNISYSLDGGITWINQTMTQVSDFMWKYWINATTNIIFKIVAGDGSAESIVYWIIVGPWKYPIYLYFSTDEQYFPVAGLDFDGDSTVENNWESYEITLDYWKVVFEDNDIDQDGTPDVWSYAYVNPKTLDDGCLVTEYWIYYAFNRYPVVGEIFRDDHEHDFETVYLWIDLATGNIKKVACSQHSWVNHYIFDVNNPPKALNMAVEEGGHGMALLKDEDNDGFPDLNDFGWYSIVPGYDWLGHQEGFIPWFKNPWTINPDSFVAQLYPWVIYDPRIPTSKLHLFDDPSTLTNGLSLDVLSPMLPNIIGEIPQYYGYLSDLLGVNCVLKTSFGAPVLDNFSLVFSVIAPLYRQEFRNPSLYWNKVSFGWWLAKQTVKLAVGMIKGGILKYFDKASNLGYVVPVTLAEILTKYGIHIMFDPIDGTVLDNQGRVLGYVNGTLLNELPTGVVLMSRNMTGELYDLFCVFDNETDSYVYQVEGSNDENYTMSVSRIDIYGENIGFDAVGIPIRTYAIHKYFVNWTLLEEGGLGVEVWVDKDGDGTAEYKFFSDAELTASEFEEQTVDIIAPSIIIISPRNETYSMTSVPLNFTLNESASWMGYSLDGQMNVTVSENTTLTGLDDGSHHIIVYANDTAGNMGTSNAVYFTVDTNPPNITDVSQIPPISNVQPEDEVKINATVTDDSSEVRLVLLNYTYANSSGTWNRIVTMTKLQANIWNATIPAFPCGTNVTYIIIAIDSANNTITSEELGCVCRYDVIPEFPSFLILLLFMIATLLVAIVYSKKTDKSQKASAAS